MRTRTLFLAILPIVCGRPSFAAPAPEQLRADLQYVTRQLPAIHPNLFFSTSAADFQAAARLLDAEAPQFSPEQFYTRLNALVATIHDSHTSLRLDGPSAAAPGFTRLPVRFRIFTDGVFVTAAPSDQAPLNRARLLHIGGVPVAEVLTLLETHIAHDNDPGLRAGLGVDTCGMALSFRYIAVSMPAEKVPPSISVYTLNTVDKAASAGSTLQIFATGYGPPDGPTAVWIANRPAEIVYSGLVAGVPGLWQINARIPDEAAISKQVPVFLASHGFVSNGVTIYATRDE